MDVWRCPVEIVFCPLQRSNASLRAGKTEMGLRAIIIQSDSNVFASHMITSNKCRYWWMRAPAVIYFGDTAESDALGSLLSVPFNQNPGVEARRTRRGQRRGRDIQRWHAPPFRSLRPHAALNSPSGITGNVATFASWSQLRFGPSALPLALSMMTFEMRSCCLRRWSRSRLSRVI